MALPALDHRGLLPDGVHEAGLQEIHDRFCVNQHRGILLACFRLFLNELATRVGPSELITAGSFYSDKDDPEDIEATVVTGHDAQLIGKAVVYFGERARIKRVYNVDYYPTLPGQYNFVDFFRYVGPKTAVAKSLSLKDRRGVVRLLKWANG